MKTAGGNDLSDGISVSVVYANLMQWIDALSNRGYEAHVLTVLPRLYPRVVTHAVFSQARKRFITRLARKFGRRCHHIQFRDYDLNNGGVHLQDCGNSRLSDLVDLC